MEENKMSMYCGITHIWNVKDGCPQCKVIELKEQLKEAEEKIQHYKTVDLEKSIKLNQLENEIERLRKGIDRSIYHLANEDISDTYVVDEIRMDLVTLLRGGVIEKDVDDCTVNSIGEL
jgi:hypothetical protein